MLDIKKIREEKDLVKEKVFARGGEFPVDEAYDLDQKRRDILAEVEQMKHVLYDHSRGIPRAADLGEAY